MVIIAVAITMLSIIISLMIMIILLRPGELPNLLERDRPEVEVDLWFRANGNVKVG